MSRAKHWCFTINNYSAEDESRLRDLSSTVPYLIFGRETGEAGTPHLQGFISFGKQERFAHVRNAIGGRAHLEVARSKPAVAAAYCKKESDFEEFGECPGGAGTRSDLVQFFEWSDSFFQSNSRAPTTPEIAREHPSVLTKFPRAVTVSRLRFDAESLVSGDPKEWQRELADRLTGSADDRTIEFIVDVEGGKGKTWFVKWYYQNHRDETQILGVAKRDDLAHMVSESKRVFFINVSRGQMDFLQYSVLEMLKDRVVVSPKYDSRTKILKSVPHVVVMCNEVPDMSKLSSDRYKITEF